MSHRSAQTLGGHRAGIPACFDIPISTGPLEGTDTEIKTLQNHAYNFQDSEFFKLTIEPLAKRTGAGSVT